VKNDVRIKDVVKKYNVSVFTVCQQLRKDDWSAEPREGPTKLKEGKKLVQILEKSSEISASTTTSGS